MNTLQDKLLILLESLRFILPEAVLVAGILVILILDLIVKRKDVLKILAVLFSVVTFLLTYQQLSFISEKPVHLFLNMLTLDKMSILWRLVLDAGLVLILLMSFAKDQKYKGEYLIMFLAVALGAHLLIMSSHLLSVYLSLELMSIGGYILANYSFSKQSHEAGIKYLLFGGVASAVMIYGFSLIYSLTGSMSFTDPAFMEALMEAHLLTFTVAGLMVISGFLFKISAAPFHIWTPDVYMAAPTPAVVLFSIVPKLAGFAILVKWMLVVNLFGSSAVPWIDILVVVAAITVTIGNFGALWQNNAKRMLAYSSIAHSGFLLMAVVAFSQTGIQSLLFYGVVYLLMNVAAFMIIHYYEKYHNIKEIRGYSGLNTKHMPMTILVVLVMISLTGLPPTAGFTAKLFVFSALWESFQLTENRLILFLFVFGLLNTVVGLFYYLKIPYFMIFKKAEEKILPQRAPFENFLTAMMVLGLLLLFFQPNWLMDIFNNVNFAF